MLLTIHIIIHYIVSLLASPLSRVLSYVCFLVSVVPAVTLAVLLVRKHGPDLPRIVMFLAQPGSYEGKKVQLTLQVFRKKHLYAHLRK